MSLFDRKTTEYTKRNLSVSEVRVEGRYLSQICVLDRVKTQPGGRYFEVSFWRLNIIVLFFLCRNFFFFFLRGYFYHLFDLFFFLISVVDHILLDLAE